jgi:hypothetical protein
VLVRFRSCLVLSQWSSGLSALLIGLWLSTALRAEPVAVRHTEGLVRGFLALRQTDAVTIADGELIQTARGDRVTTRLVFRFPDGSVHDETAVFTQRGHFRLVRDRLVQKGPTFPHPLDMSIDVATGQVDVRYTDDHGEAKKESAHLDLPADLANGIIPILFKNISPDAPPEKLSFVVATPKPRVVGLEVHVGGRERFLVGRTAHMATHYMLKVDIGGLSGLLAPLVGKQPPDSHVWILGGDAPAFVKSEQPLFFEGPVWRIELVSPVWPREREGSR